ncbi:MAG: glycosyltransferase, partial [Promethearchaeota archaeon]
DKSYDIIKEKYFSKYIVKKFSTNYGFAMGNNLAAKLSHGKYLIFLNNDTLVEKNWLNEIYNYLKEKSEDIQVILGLVIYFNIEKNLVLSLGGGISLLGSGYDYAFGKRIKELPLNPSRVGYICGACLIINKDLFFSLNGFDNKFYCYNEDVDLCWRAWTRGIESIFIPRSKLTHLLSASSNYYNKDKRDVQQIKKKISNVNSTYFKIYYAQRNRLSSIIKNFNLIYCIGAFTLSLIYDLFRFYRYMKQNKKTLINAILSGYVFFLKNVGNCIKKRRDVQKERMVGDYWLIKNNIIKGIVPLLREFNRLNKNNLLL